MVPSAAVVACVGLYVVGVTAYGGSSVGADDCLPYAIPANERVNLIKDPLGSATPVPLQILTAGWLSVDIISDILHILVAEVMGINATVVEVSASADTLYAAADCSTFRVINDRGCPDVMPAHTDYVVFLEVWWFESSLNAIKSLIRGYAIDNLGSIGYAGTDALCGIGSAKGQAYEDEGLPLEYFKSYNASWTRPWGYFPNMSAIDTSKLMPCSGGNLANSEFASIHARVTQDVEGTEQAADGHTVYKCWDGFWWRAPACRNAPERCIPVTTGGVGWFLDTMAMWAAAYNMPLALAIASPFDNYLSLPRLVGNMFYAWQPDPSYLDLGPFRVAFPHHDPLAWSLGDKRTDSPDNGLRKIASANLATQYPFLRKLIYNMLITQSDIDSMLLTWKVDGGTRSTREEACTWIKSNEQTWRGWIPDTTACVEGMGLADLGLKDVLSRSQATACRWCPAGKRSELLEDAHGSTRVCQLCPPGQHSELPGQLLCSACSPGTFSEENGTVHCQKCSPGSHAEQAGQTGCKLCSPGSASALMGSRHCSACLPGTWQAEPGSTSCEICPSGFFQSRSDSAHCTNCNEVVVGSSSSRGASSAAECQCPIGSVQHDSPPVCEDCTSRTGLNCTGGSSEPLQLAGYWVQVLDAARREYSVFQCRNSLECPAGTLGACAAGRVGKACNSCVDGHYPLGDGRCQTCEGARMLPLIALIVFILTVVLVAAVLMRMDATTQRLSTLTVVVTLGQLATALQALGTLHQLSVIFVDPAQWMLRLLSLVLTFDLGPLRGQCLFQKDDPVLIFSSKLLVLPAFAVPLLLLWCVSKTVRKPVALTGILNAIGLLAMIFFISITLSVLMPVQCRRNPNGSFSMLTEPGVECFGSREHWTLASLAVVGFLMYPVAMFSWAVWATLRYPVLARTQNGLRVLKCQAFFFGRFSPQTHYFGLVLLTRNFLAPMIPVALVSVPEVQCLAMCLVLQVPLCLEATLRPWRTPAANWSALVTNTMLVIAVVSVAPIVDVSSNRLEGARKAISWYFLCCFSLILGFALLSISAGLYYHFRQKKQKKYGAFICHHKAGAGALARLIKMLLQRCTTSRIFLDSDELDDLDRLFDIVRSRTRNLVVLLSGDVLHRVWCAGEIATACKNSVKMFPLSFDGFHCPNDRQALRIFKTWTDQERTALNTHGIDKGTVLRGYAQLRDRPMFRLLRTADLATKSSVVQNLACACGLGTMRPFYASEVEGDSESLTDIFVLGSPQNKEALASCEILQMMLQEFLQTPVHVMRGAEEEKNAENCCTLLVVLTEGLLEDTDFAEALLKVVDAAAERNGTLLMVPLLADKTFQFLNTTDYARLGDGLPGWDINDGSRLVEAYRELFSTSTEPFSPLGSEKLMKTEVRELCRRRFSNLELVMTASSSRGQELAMGKTPTSHGGEMMMGKTATSHGPERAQDLHANWAGSPGPSPRPSPSPRSPSRSPRPAVP